MREALNTGDIHSLYRISISGEWLTLRDYLEQVDAVDLERRAAALGAHCRSQSGVIPSDAAPTAGMRLLTIQAPVFLPEPTLFPPSLPDHRASGAALKYEAEPAPTCWLAVTAFVVSCASFVPYLNLVSWFPSLVLGHLALQKIHRHPQLEGRGLALGALFIGYATVML